MTPPRMVELQCPSCAVTHWEIDSDFRGITPPVVPYEDRDYTCPRCGHRGSGYTVKQKSPPTFFLQPHDLYPMPAAEFKHWLAILKEHFPDHSKLKELGMSWYPGKQRRDHRRRLHVTVALGSSLRILFSDTAVGIERLYVIVQKTDLNGGEATFWVEPVIELYQHYYGFNPTELAEVATQLGRQEAAIRKAWQRYAEDVRAFQRKSLALLEKATDARPSLWHRILSFLGLTHHST